MGYPGESISATRLNALFATANGLFCGCQYQGSYGFFIYSSQTMGSKLVGSPRVVARDFSFPSVCRVRFHRSTFIVCYFLYE